MRIWWSKVKITVTTQNMFLTLIYWGCHLKKSLTHLLKKCEILKHPLPDFKWPGMLIKSADCILYKLLQLECEPFTSYI